MNKLWMIFRPNRMTFEWIVSRRRRGRDRRARDHRRVDRARPGREARRDRRVLEGVRRAFGATHRRCRHEQHPNDASGCEGAGGYAGARRDADRGAVLRASVGGRDRRSLQGSGRGEPRAARRLQHPRPNGAEPERAEPARARAHVELRRGQAGPGRPRRRHARAPPACAPSGSSR